MDIGTLLFGGLVGVVIAQISLCIWHDEIMDGMDRLFGWLHWITVGRWRK